MTDFSSETTEIRKCYSISKYLEEENSQPRILEQAKRSFRSREEETKPFSAKGNPKEDDPNRPGENEWLKEALYIEKNK